MKRLCNDLFNNAKNVTKCPSLLIFMAIILFIGVGCSNDSDNVLSSVGTVNYADPAVDGCGWTIYIEKEDFHPINLSKNYRVDGTTVNLKYIIQSSSWNCPSWDTKPMRQIEIVSIALHVN